MDRLPARLGKPGTDPSAATQTLAEYGTAHMQLALRGLEPKTTDPYLTGWQRQYHLAENPDAPPHGNRCR